MQIFLDVKNRLTYIYFIFVPHIYNWDNDRSLVVGLEKKISFRGRDSKQFYSLFWLESTFVKLVKQTKNVLKIKNNKLIACTARFWFYVYISEVLKKKIHETIFEFPLFSFGQNQQY